MSQELHMGHKFSRIALFFEKNKIKMEENFFSMILQVSVSGSCSRCDTN